MADINYNAQNIISAINNYQENNQVIAQVSSNNTYTSTNISALSVVNNTTDTSSLMSITNRIKFYLSLISSNISTIVDIQKSISTNINNNTDLSNYALVSKNLCCNLFEGEQHIVGHDHEDFIAERREIIEYMYSSLLSSPLQISTNFQYNKLTIGNSDLIGSRKITCDIKNIIHNQNNFLTNNIANNQVFQYFSLRNENKNTLIYSSDILMQLNSFIDKLDKIYNVEYKISLLKNNLSTATRMVFLCPYYQKEENIEARRTTQFYISPYSEVYSPVNYSTTIASNSKTKEKIYNNKINLDNLIYIPTTNIFSSPIQLISIDDQGSNGVFSFQFNVNKKTDNTSLKKYIGNIKNIFSIEKGNIISRKKILSAIDYIFQLWLSNIQTLILDIKICHSNCHNNCVGLYVTVSGGSVCCYCGNCGCVHISNDGIIESIGES